MVRGVILACICIVGLASCSSEDPWETTCRLYEAHVEAPACDNLEPPKVVYEEMRDGLQGYYDGSDTIYLNEDLRGRDKFATTLHEMVHYIDVMWGGLPIPGPASLVCQSEDRAWFLEGVWWGIVGQPEKANPDWWKWYPHCWPYYAPQKFQLSIQEWVDIMGIGNDPIIIEVENEPNP